MEPKTVTLDVNLFKKAIVMENDNTMLHHWRPEGEMVKKSIWVSGQSPTLSITINGPPHTSLSINALAGS